MEEYIKRNKAIANLRKLIEMPNYMRVKAISAVTNVADSDVIKIVRCKDCKFKFSNNEHDKEGCPIVDRHLWMDDDGFCSAGKRM